MGVIDCPFCGFHATGDYQIMLHMEEFHPENGESPFIVKNDPDKMSLVVKDSNGEDFVMCPVEGCGELILLAELDSHFELHAVEGAGSTPEVGSSKASTKGKPVSSSAASTHSTTTRSKQETAIASWKDIFHMPISSPSSKSGKPRYDKSQLGPHANEHKMPDWVRKILETDGCEKPSTRVDANGKTRKVMAAENQSKDILPVLGQLLHQDKATSYAYLCHPAVQHVFKLPREGGFCGYRNIQSLTSFIVNTKSQGYPIFNGKIPTIFQIQNYIEDAWDMGINKQGRAETGGIRGTRKYIGTPEAQAMFISLDISCDAGGIKAKGDVPAYERLFNEVESYFKAGALQSDAIVRHTMLPPLYYQQPGHSMTIIGFEKKTNGDKNILVFDPMFHDSSAITKFIGNDQVSHNKPAELLKAYRRGTSYLKRFREFELLRLTPPKT